MSWKTLAPALALVVTAPVPARSDRHDEVFAVCDSLPNAYDCSPLVERRELARSAGTAWRSGERLSLRLVDGRTIAFENDAEAMETCAYAGYWPEIDAHLLWRLAHEWEAFDLVSARTGIRTRIGSAPVVSPDGQRFIALTSLASDEPVRIFVRRKRFEVEYTSDGDDAVPIAGDARARWRGNRSIELLVEGAVVFAYDLVEGKWRWRCVSPENCSPGESPSAANEAGGSSARERTKRQRGWSPPPIPPPVLGP